MRFVGIDGYCAGWLAAWREPDAPRAATFPTLAALLDALAPDVAALDMPIGLAEGDRTCDKEARALLGPRRSSVFAPPARRVLHETTFRPGMGISLQAFDLLPRLRDVDATMTPALQARVKEAHPELAFAALGGAPMRHPKRTQEGRAERGCALGRIPGDPFRAVRRDPLGWKKTQGLRGVAVDDLLDACALAWTAQRIARQEARALGDGARDARGLAMEIWH